MMLLRQLKINKYSILFFLLIVFIFIEIIIMSPGLLENSSDGIAEPEKLNQTVVDDKNTIEQKMLGVHIVEKGDGESGWELFANKAEGTSSAQWVVQKVKVQFFNENKSEFTVTGDVGEIDGNSKDMIIRGNVTTTSANGYSFNTATLQYLAKQKLMTSVDKVTMEGPADKSGAGFKLNGEKLLVDITKNKMSILDKIEATKKMNDKNFNLSSVRADFSNKNQEASFFGDVKMSLAELSIKSPVAHFYYSKATKNLDRIVLKNGVEFIESDRKGSCSELEMNLVENKMTMRGQPKVQQGEDEISGQEIIFIDGGKKVKINKTSKTRF